MASVCRALRLYLSLTTCFTLSICVWNAESANDDATFNPNQAAKLLNLPEAVAFCSSITKSLIYFEENTPAQNDTFVTQYLSLQENSDTRFWIGAYLSSGTWDYTYIDITGKKTSTNPTSEYQRARQEVIRRAKDTPGIYANKEYRYACSTFDLNVNCIFENSVSWRYFESKCFAAPHTNESIASSQCINVSSSIAKVSYEYNKKGRLYGFLAGWFNQLYPMKVIKNTKAVLYACEYVET